MGWGTSWFRLKRKKATAVPPLGSKFRMVSVCIRVVGFELEVLVGDFGGLNDCTAGRLMIRESVLCSFSKG